MNSHDLHEQLNDLQKTLSNQTPNLPNLESSDLVLPKLDFFLIEI